jgi:YgiT-type zinc finger domain-containing protein
MNDDSHLTPPQSCPNCVVGKPTVKYLTYYTEMNGKLITAPNFPASVCDVCGWSEYHPGTVVWLDFLLSAPLSIKPRYHKPGGEAVQPGIMPIIE